MIVTTRPWLNGPNGLGDFFYYEELPELMIEILQSQEGFYLEDPLEKASNLCNEEHTEECLSSELEWSRNRQAEWYELFRSEYDLTEEDYVDEQDLLDWLGANFTITRTVTQEI